jgi:hypothetical protein
MTPDEKVAREKLMSEFHRHLESQLARRGTTIEAVLDSDCYGTRSQKFTNWLHDMLFNVRIAFGWV